MYRYKKGILAVFSIICALFAIGCSSLGSVSPADLADPVDAMDPVDTMIAPDPTPSTYCRLQVLRDHATADEPFRAEVAFGTDWRYSTYFDIIVESEDLLGTYPEEYVVDEVRYKSSDFLMDYSRMGEVDYYDLLPQKFELTLKSSRTREWYENSVKILIHHESTESMMENVWETLYYCGTDDLLCFSKVSLEAAKALYDALK